MNEVAQISKAPPELKSQDFDFLREEGMELLRTTAANTWTDHNLHDPGITLLEALCYAITEMGLRADMDMRDLIASDNSGYNQPFYTAAEILPAGALTVSDFRKILTDHPLVRNAWLAALATKPAGRYDVLIEFADEDVNTNTFDIPVTPAALSSTYHVDVAFPYWDEEDVLPFYESVTLLNVTFDSAPGDEWKPIAGSDAYFARITVDYQPSVGGPQSTQLWLVAQVNSPMENPLGDLPLILAELTTEIANIVGDNWLADFNNKVISAHNQVRIIRRYLKDYRNLCEDFLNFKPARLQEIAVSAIIDVNQGVVLEDLLANIFFRIDRFIDPSILFERLDDLLKDQSSDNVFEGPLLASGFLPEASLDSTSLPDTFYTSDILRLILQLRDQSETDVVRREDFSTRNIVAVRNLSLSNYLDNRRITSNARDCLHLVESQRHIPRLSPLKSRISFYRDGVEVDYDLDQVILLFKEKKKEALAQQAAGPADIPLPTGVRYEAEAYYPVQNDLPLTYGVGEAGLPETASEKRKAQALQLKGYLFLYEQLIAGMASQLTHLNALFSTDPALDRTIFQQPLYHLPQVAPLLKSFDPLTQNWTAFLNDPDNGYITSLKETAESREQFLSRRNAVLDHLLAVFGEDMQERAALVLRKAAVVPNAASLTLNELLAAQATQRNLASAQLIREKSAWVDDLPAVNRDRAQSYGNPVWRTGKLLQTVMAGGELNWVVTDGDGAPLFRAVAGSIITARRLAAEALSLATREDNYYVKAESGGQHRLELRPGAASMPVAETETTYASNALALAAIPGMVQAVVQLWTGYGLSPMESRLYHMLGVRIKQRRQLIHPLNEYFEIFDEPIPNPDFEKRFRLWELPGFAGDQLLASEDHYPGTSDGDAIENTEAVIETVISRGLFAENYIIENPAANIYQAVLTLSGGTPVARSGNLTTHELAEAEADRIRRHLYRWYSAEGFCMVEHMRLYPVAPADTALTIGDSTDPYSFQISVILPSGFARDFSGTDRRPYQPENNADPEYRRYAELQIRKACPAHILPRILWVDRADPDAVSSPADPSFDNFEQRYRAWFQAWIVDEPQETVMAPLRNGLVEILNAIYQDISV